jgi:hypothetical protein
LSIRLFSAAGAALDVYLFQLAVRREEREGREAAERQVARNGILVLALLAPLAAGFFAAMPAFEALLVPPAFRGSFARLTSLLLPGILAYCLVQFALNPVFQIARRTGPAVAAALLALGVDAGALALPAAGDPAFSPRSTPPPGRRASWPPSPSPRGRRATGRAPRRRAVLLSAGAMAGAVWPLRDLDRRARLSRRRAAGALSTAPAPALRRRGPPRDWRGS